MEKDQNYYNIYQEGILSCKKCLLDNKAQMAKIFNVLNTYIKDKFIGINDNMNEDNNDINFDD